jgi:hypothetical protein
MQIQGVNKIMEKLRNREIELVYVGYIDRTSVGLNMLLPFVCSCQCSVRK